MLVDDQYDAGDAVEGAAFDRGRFQSDNRQSGDYGFAREFHRRFHGKSTGGKFLPDQVGQQLELHVVCMEGIDFRLNLSNE